MDAPLLLVNGEGAALVAENGDYVAVRELKEVKKVFWIETKRVWEIAMPIVFNIWCQFGVNSVTSMFVGHLGDIQLSAISLINSVIGTFAFGFMVSAFVLLFRCCGLPF